MTPKQELKLAYRLAAILFIVGFFSYLAFSAPSPEQPVRMVFKSAAGKVLFDHKTHTDGSGYGLACDNCHHTLEEGEYEDVESCRECHEPVTEDEDIPKISDAFHQQCIGCHQDYDAGPVACAICHNM